jgi:hypothetical protein
MIGEAPALGLDTVHEPKVVVDASRMPLVVQRFRQGFDDADVEHMFRQFEFLFLSGRRYALLVYTDPGPKVMTARQRKMVADWGKAHIEQIRRVNVASAVVIESALVRGALTALTWLFEPPTPQKLVRTLREGLDFCVASLISADVMVPDNVRALLDAPERKLLSHG